MSDPCVRMLDWLQRNRELQKRLAKEHGQEGRESEASYHFIKAFALLQAEQQFRHFLELEERA